MATHESITFKMRIPSDSSPVLFLWLVLAFFCKEVNAYVGVALPGQGRGGKPAISFLSSPNQRLSLSRTFALSATARPPKTPSAPETIVDPSLPHSPAWEEHQRNGDARGAALLVENLSVIRGSAGSSSSTILQNVSWRIEPRTKWALVGTNGSGKSTLLKAIVNEIDYQEGSINIASKAKIGYLQQTAVAGSKRTIYEEAASGMNDLNDAREAMEKAMERGDLDALDRATTRFEALGGYKQEERIANVLSGLGFQDFDIRCDELSGGWQMRVAFARLLLSEPTLCLMDEPSNHLDAAAKKWLAKYLAEYQGEGAMVLVTHDVELLQSMDHIAEISAGRIQVYKSCTYDEFLRQKEERASAAVTQYEKNMEKAAKLQAFVDRFGASATKASAAQSRVKQIDRMKKEGLLDTPGEAVIAQRFKPSLKLCYPAKSVGDVLLSLEDASIGYGDRELIKNVNIDITKGMRMLIRGRNGAGKSTLLHSLRGTLPLFSGMRKENPSLHLGVFTQDLAQELDPMSRAVDLVTAYAREGKGGRVDLTEQEARSTMGGLGLQGDKALRQVCDLSGGEKARVALSMFALKPANLYLLDEASNHLDVECVDALSEALSQWDIESGALVVISHDRSFCEKIDFTHVLTIADGEARLEQRNTDNKDWSIGDLSMNRSSRDTSNTDKNSPAKDIDPQIRKKLHNAPKRISKLEKLIEEMEEKIAELDKDMLMNGSDVGRLVDLQKERNGFQEKMDNYMMEWEELEELLATTAK